MATLPNHNLPTKRKPKYKAHHCDRNKYVYNTGTWRQLRWQHLESRQGLCERCEANGIIKDATCVHHKIWLSKAQGVSDLVRLGFDPDNLEALCDDCHKAEHAPKRNLYLD